MTYSTIKEVITAAGLDPLLTYTDNGMWFTPIDAEKWEGHDDKGTALHVTSLVETIEIPPSVYRTPGQIEIFKSNLIVKMATKIINSIFTTTTGVATNAVMPMLPNAVETNTTVTNPAEAYDALLSVGLVDSFKIFNGKQASELDYTGTTYNTVFENVVQIDAAKLVALEAVRGAYLLYLPEIEWEEKKERKNNKIFLQATVYLQGMPTMPINTASLA